MPGRVILVLVLVSSIRPLLADMFFDILKDSHGFADWLHIHVLPVLPASLSPLLAGTDTGSAMNPLAGQIVPIGITLLVAAAYAYLKAKSINIKHKRIPGPRALPLIGNALDWPSEHQAVSMALWQQSYGPLTKLSILGKNILFLTSTRAISELFVKRGATFSDRPQLVFSQELCGMDVLHPMTQFGDDFRDQRKFMKEVLAPEVQRRHAGLLDEEARRLLKATFERPQDAARHLRRFSTSFALRMVYGLPALEVDDPNVLLAEEMMALSEYAIVGGWAVDFIPALKHLPSWFPFQKRAKYYRAKIIEMMSKPWEEVKAKVLAGTATESFCSINMQKFDDGTSKHTETLIKATAAALYGAGADTSACAAHSFLLAMLLHPTIQSRAQAELDSVIGHDDDGRLPSIADKAQLPYLARVVWEVLRWAPPVPVSIPHRNRADAEFDGYLIPKDTMMLASLYSMSRDPELYHAPEEFNPDRFEGPNGERLPHYVFGLGPRRCPGADVAYTQLFHQAACLLTCFTILPARDSNGDEIIPQPKFSGKMVRNVEEFPFVIRPRYEGVAMERLLGVDA
ncbi:cytochrome P450 [Mycena amicta]|nr:cytochrome P450 [Mycena amicta]